jgi:hypothetical protein
MCTLVLDQPAIDQLRVLSVGVEIRDQQGTLIGYYRPAVGPADVDQYECPVAAEELDRRSRKGGGRPLTEIWADLERRM